MTPSPGQVSIPNSLPLFFSFIFCPFEDNWLPFWVTGVLCQHSEVVWWKLLSIHMIFWWICGRESGFLVLFLHHLGNPPSTPLPTTPILFSQFLETAILLSVSRNLPALGTSSKWSHVISFPLWQLLISLSIMSLSFMHVAACVRISFSLKAEWCSTVCVYHIFCLSIWWAFVFLLPFDCITVNYAAMNFGVQLSVRILVFNFLSISPIPRVELWNHMIIICLIF